jgi:hypothetical protein
MIDMFIVQHYMDHSSFWFKNNNPNTKIPSNKEFINNLKKYKDILCVRVE